MDSAGDLLAFPSITALPWWGILPYGALFMLLGVWLAFWPPKRNWWGGIRVSWTYADEEIWYRANRLTGWTILISGVLMAAWAPLGLAAALILPVSMIPYARAVYIRRYGTARTWRAGKGWRGFRPVARCPYCERETELESPDEVATRRCDGCGNPLMIIGPTA